MIRLSIIIPFYNVEQYIAQCLDSVYQQDIPEEEYEVICVNDASPDNSRAIVQEYQKKHSNLILIEHEVNKKLGAARNTGRSIAKGEYIWNVDSDDMITPNCLGEILRICESKNLDVLEVGYRSTVGKSYIHGVTDSNVYNGQLYIKMYYINNIGAICPIWRKIFRKEFLDKNDIYSPSINMGEDEAFAMHVFAKAERVGYDNNEYYIYRINNASLTGDKVQMLKADKWYEASILCPLAMHQVLLKVSSDLDQLIYQQYYNMIRYDIMAYWDIEIEDKEKKKYWRECLRNIKGLIPLMYYLSRKAKYQFVKYLIRYAL